MKQIGQALEFDDKEAYVEVKNSDSLNITGQISLLAWIYPNEWFSGDGDELSEANRKPKASVSPELAKELNTSNKQDLK